MINLKSRQILKIVFLMSMQFSYYYGYVSKIDKLNYVARKEDKIYVDVDLVHDISALMIDLTCNQEGIKLPSMIKTDSEIQQLDISDQFQAFDQTERYYIFLDQNKRSIIQIIKNEIRYFDSIMNSVLEEEKNLYCEDLKTAVSYLIIICQNKNSQGLEVFVISLNAEKIILNFPIENIKYKNPKLSIVSIQKVNTFVIYGIVYDKYEHDSDFVIQENFYEFKIVVQQSNHQVNKSFFRDGDVDYELKDFNIRSLMKEAKVDRYQILKVNYTIENLNTEYIDEYEIQSKMIQYKVQNDPYSKLITYQKQYSVNLTFDTQQNIDKSKTEIFCRKNFCFYISDINRFIFINIISKQAKQYIKVPENLKIIKIYSSKYHSILILKNNETFSAVLCNLRHEQCQIYPVDSINFDNTFIRQKKQKDLLLFTINKGNIEYFNFKKNSLLEIDVSQIDTNKPIEVFQEKKKFLTIQIQLLEKDKLYLQNDNNIILQQAGQTKNFRVQLPYYILIDELKNEKNFSFDYFNQAQIRNQLNEDQGYFKQHPIVNNDIFTYLVQKQMRVYNIENFKLIPKTGNIDINLNLLKSQQNYFQGYSMGSSRRIMGQKIDMSSNTQKGQNVIYDTFVYDIVEYKTDFVKLQQDVCTYSQSFMICVVKDHYHNGINTIQIYSLDYDKRNLAQNEIFNDYLFKNLRLYFEQFTNKKIDEITITFEKILIFNINPNKILILAKDESDQDRLSVHLLDFSQYFVNKNIMFEISFVMYLDFKNIHKINHYFFTLYNQKLIVINRKEDIYVNVFDLNFNISYKIFIDDNVFEVKTQQYNLAKNFLALVYIKNEDNKPYLKIIRIKQNLSKQIILKKQLDNECSSAQISMYKINVKYLFISIYDKYDGEICQIYTLNLKGAFVSVNSKDKFVEILNKKYPIKFQIEEGYQDNEVKQLQKLEIDRSQFQDDLIQIDKYFTTKGNIKSYSISNMHIKGELVQKLEFQDPFIENDLKSADAFQFSCNECFITKNVLINKNNQNLQFTLQIIDLETKKQTDISSKECDDFAFSEGKIFCFVNELVGTRVVEYQINETGKYTHREQYKRILQFQGKDYYYKDIDENQAILTVIHQQQTIIYLTTMSKMDYSKYNTSFPYSLTISQRDFLDQELFVDKIYLSQQKMGQNAYYVNIIIYDSINNQIKMADIQFEDTLQNAILDTQSFDLGVFERETYSLDCNEQYQQYYQCLLLGKVKAYYLNVYCLSDLKTGKLNWRIELRYQYYLTIPFINFYNHNPIAAESEKYLMITNKTSYHTNQSVYIYHKNKEPYVKYTLFLGQNCIVYEMKVIKIEDKEQLIVVFEYQGVGLQIKYFDITNESFLKLDPNFDILSDNNKFKLDIKFINGFTETLDITITDIQKQEKHAAILANRKVKETPFIYAATINTIGIMLIIGLIIAIILKEKKNREEIRRELQEDQLDLSQIENQF